MSILLFYDALFEESKYFCWKGFGCLQWLIQLLSYDLGYICLQLLDWRCLQFRTDHTKKLIFELFDELKHRLERYLNLTVGIQVTFDRILGFVRL